VLHRYLGVALAIFVLISAITGILLAFKKNISTIQPQTQKGISQSLDRWMPIDSLAIFAKVSLQKKYPNQNENEIDKIDVRPSKGIAKVIFEKGYLEVQIDGVTGEVKSIERRHSDWIEQVHDGSIIHHIVKLITMNFLGFGLIIMLFSGLWMWYGPKKIRSLKRKIRDTRRKN